VDADTEEIIIRLRKKLSKQGLDAGAETIAAGGWDLRRSLAASAAHYGINVAEALYLDASASTQPAPKRPPEDRSSSGLESEAADR
jgi:hypothetical protein